MRLLFVPVALAALLLCAAPASAQDFTFTVPVRIENMRHIESANVNCTVLAVVGVERRSLSVAPPVAVPIRDGAFRGNITVPVNVSSGYTRSDATNWYCSLTYNWRMPDGTLFNRSLSSGERPTNYTRYTGQTVTSTVESVQGTIPR